MSQLDREFGMGVRCWDINIKVTKLVTHYFVMVAATWSKWCLGASWSSDVLMTVTKCSAG